MYVLNTRFDCCGIVPWALRTYRLLYEIWLLSQDIPLEYYRAVGAEPNTLNAAISMGMEIQAATSFRWWTSTLIFPTLAFYTGHYVGTFRILFLTVVVWSVRHTHLLTIVVLLASVARTACIRTLVLRPTPLTRSY